MSLPLIPENAKKSVMEIIREVCDSFPYDERVDLPKIDSVETFVNLTGINANGDKFYLTPYLVSFYKLLKREQAISEQ